MPPEGEPETPPTQPDYEDVESSITITPDNETANKEFDANLFIFCGAYIGGGAIINQFNIGEC
jgi:hypothetical protein